MTATEVRDGTTADAAAIARTLALAFDGNPPTRWVLPRDGDRVDRLIPFFGGLLRHWYLPHGTVHVTADGQAAALWMAPGRWPPPRLATLRLVPVSARVHRRHIRRSLRAAAEVKRGQPTEPNWYLEWLGAVPGAQGGGRGSALLRAVLDRADQEGSPASLEAGSPRARDLYLRHGFEVTEEFRLPGGGPPMWRMWRPAGSG